MQRPWYYEHYNLPLITTLRHTGILQLHPDQFVVSSLSVLPSWLGRVSLSSRQLIPTSLPLAKVLDANWHHLWQATWGWGNELLSNECLQHSWHYELQLFLSPKITMTWQSIWKSVPGSWSNMAAQSIGFMRTGEVIPSVMDWWNHHSKL